MKRILQRAIARGAGISAVSRPLAELAGRRDRSLVLLYHDIVGEGESRGIIRPVSASLLARHIAVLRGLGDVVPLTDLLEPSRTQRPRFAITFDDDSASYATHALPVLVRSGVTATFFLSGRALNGLDPYWWDVLDWWIMNRGGAATAAALGAPDPRPDRLAAWCEGNAAVDRLFVPEALHSSRKRLLDHRGIDRLVEMKMHIGFHTLRHPVLTELDDDDLVDALAEGRGGLEEVVGDAVDTLSYPHGRTDRRVARATAAAGYRAAFGSRGRPVSAATDRMLMDRWEPGPLTEGGLRGEIAWRLNRSLS